MCPAVYFLTAQLHYSIGAPRAARGTRKNSAFFPCGKKASKKHTKEGKSAAQTPHVLPLLAILPLFAPKAYAFEGAAPRQDDDPRRL